MCDACFASQACKHSARDFHLKLNQSLQSLNLSLPELVDLLQKGTSFSLPPLYFALGKKINLSVGFQKFFSLHFYGKLQGSAEIILVLNETTDFYPTLNGTHRFRVKPVKTDFFFLGVFHIVAL